LSGYGIFFENTHSRQTKTQKDMKTVLYIIAVIMIIGWLLGFFAFNAGYLIHALLVLALISFLLTLIRWNKN
jgi:uncharacterized membrane protein AbrB (regulator of aidB expression)